MIVERKALLDQNEELPVKKENIWSGKNILVIGFETILSNKSTKEMIYNQLKIKV